MVDSTLYEVDPARVQLSVRDDGENYLTITDTRVGGEALDEMPVSDEFVEAFLDEFDEEEVQH